MRKEHKKKSTIINNNEGILQKKFFNRRRNALVNEQLLKFHQKKKITKVNIFKKKRRSFISKSFKNEKKSQKGKFNRTISNKKSF